MQKRTKPSLTPLTKAPNDKDLLAQALVGVIPLYPIVTHVIKHSSKRDNKDNFQLKRAHAQTNPDHIHGLSDLSDGHLWPDQVQPDQYRSPGVGPDTLRQLKRGNWPVTANLDLHGMTVDVAREQLSAFINQAYTQGRRCVLVVHGQGLGSALGHARLKQHSRFWLTQMAVVRAFVEAPNKQGGSGAVLVLIAALPT